MDGNERSPAATAADRRRGSLRRLFEKTDDPYAGADLARAKRLGAFLWVAGTAVAAALLPFAPPTEAVGEAGWIAAAAIILVCLAGAWRLGRQAERVTLDELLFTSYAGLAQIALLEWLAGGQGSPYQQLFLISLTYTACVHPPRRAAPVIALAALAVFAPLAYDGWDAAFAVGTATQFLIWFGLCSVGILLMSGVRAQRVGLRNEGERARRLARVDALTGLGNRRAFDEAVEAEVARARRHERPLSLIVADLDGFKDINDRYGHLNGDRCLRQVARAIGATVRVPDACFRWGGDEFAVLLAEAERDEADRIGRRLADAVTETCRKPGGEPLTLAYGAAELLDELECEDLVAAADLALLIAKERAATDEAARAHD
jgi:diguanylate cyclase (GGDEF)-like protein